MAKSIACSGCGAAVPYGRLSCPECGEMFASVAGVGRRASATAVAGRPFATAAATLTDGSPARAVSAPSVLHDATADSMEGPAGEPSPGEPSAGQLSAWPAPMDDPTAEPANALAAEATSAAESEPEPDAAQHADPEQEDAPRATARSEVAWPAAAPTERPTPGAYLPPVLHPAGPPAPARTWAGHGAGDTAATAGSTGAGATSDPGARPEKAPLAGAAAATEFVGWLAIAGAALAAAGFLLPWSVSVIGADGVGYADRWGLAGPGHILVVLAVLAILGAAALRERVPIWLGIGLPGLAVGALLVGLVWPYLVGPLGAQIGVLSVTLGGLMLAAAGIGALLVDRHVRGGRVV